MKRNFFWNGVFTYMAMNSLIQDAIGKEAYIRRVEADWVDSSITVPLAVVILTTALWHYFRKGGKDND